MGNVPRRLVAAAILAWGADSASGADDALPEFHRLKQADGGYLVTNLPPAALRADGSISPDFDPNAAPAQHARMRRGLREHAAALAARRRGGAPAEGPAARMATRRPGQPAEGFMSLPQLIELEQRGGRYQTPVPGR